MAADQNIDDIGWVTSLYLRPDTIGPFLRDEKGEAIPHRCYKLDERIDRLYTIIDGHLCLINSKSWTFKKVRKL